MTAEYISQEEIDALLKAQPEGQSERLEGVVPAEEESLRDYLRVMGKAVKDITSSLTGKGIKCDTPKYSETTAGDLKDLDPIPSVIFGIPYTSGLSGVTRFMFSGESALEISTTMTGDQDAAEVGENELSAISEVFAQVINSASRNLKNSYKTEIVGSTPEPSVLSEPATELAGLFDSPDQRLILLTYNLEFDDGNPHILYQVLENSSCGDLMSLYEDANKTVEQPKPSKSAPGPTPSIQPAVFQDINQTSTITKPSNLDLLLDIDLDVKVELGRTIMRIKDVLELGAGSVVELNKLAGEQVDLLVNNKLFAKGEVVVIDENFGVRITDILDVKERIESLAK